MKKSILFFSSVIAVMGLLLVETNAENTQVGVYQNAKKVAKVPSTGTGDTGDTGSTDDNGKLGKDSDYTAIVTEGAASFTWRTSEKYPFTIEGNKAISSNKGVASSYSWIEGDFTLSDNATLSFDFTSSSANVKTGKFTSNQDVTRIYIDGTLLESHLDVYSGSFAKELEKGQHTLRFEYSKDELGDYNDDCATISNIKLVDIPNDFMGLCDNDAAFTFNTASSKPWTCYSKVAKPGNLKENGASTSTVEFSVQKEGLYTVAFDYELLTQADADVFSIYVDGAVALSDSGHKSGKFVKKFAEGGKHTVKLEYKKTSESGAEKENLTVTNLKCYEKDFKETVRNFSAIGHTAFNDTIKFVSNGDFVRSFNTTFKFYDDGDVIIDSLFSFNHGEFEQFPIRAKYDNGKITVPANTPFAQRTTDPYNCGSLLTEKIVTGDFKTEQGWLFSEAGLVLDVNDELTKVVAPTGLGLEDTYLAFYCHDMQYGFLNEGCDLTANITEIALPQFHVGQSKKATVVLTNNGKADATYTVANDANAYASLQYKQSGAVGKMGVRDTLEIEVTGVAAGAFIIPVKVTDSSNNVTTITVSGEILPEINYNDIVTIGKESITWTSSEDYPWDVKENVANSALKGVNAPNTSTLTAKFTVPEGYIAQFRGEGAYSIGSGNYFYIYKNGTQTQSFTNSFFSSSEDYSIVENLVAGEYTFAFEHNKSGSAPSNATDEVTLKNVSLNIVPLEANNAVIDKNDVDFGENSTSTTGTRTITFTNMGSNELKVLSVEGDEIFNAEVPEGSVKTLETLSVNLTAYSTKDGEYKGKVKINTTAGSFEVNCTATFKNQLFLGDGNATGFDYPCSPSLFNKEHVSQSLYIDDRLATLKDCKITGITFYLVDYMVTSTDWADATMKWELGTTNLDNLYDGTNVLSPEGLQTVYNGPIVNFQDKQMAINFTDPITWDGSTKLVYRLSVTNSPAYSSWIYTQCTNTNYTASTLTANDGTKKYANMVPNIKIEYTLPESTDVETLVITPEAPVSVAYYTLDGRQHSQPVAGVNVVVSIYKNGSKTSHKIFRK